ncbi:hypothetical protein AYL20_01235 [Acinetobacter venetianus]|uniref:hypothetical protein n=1 Tax=Acinetobacter venetianus TaxID=52133 RepID=UPI000775F969|nr:hypothetical protein [Acinetobacter venetianus]KXO82647.1 hypothetical protein AYL20_01235 [Acinetobacter venetianus]
MSNIATPPSPIFTDIDGSPLKEGFLFVGQTGLDPETNPTSVYWDESLTDQATQPINIKNGLIVNNNVAAKLYVGSDSFSIEVKNQFSSSVFKNTEYQQIASQTKAQEYVAAEETRATTAEGQLQQNIGAEETRALAAESGLQSQINAVGVGNKAYLTYADMDADKANIPANSKVTVTNDATASNNGDYQWDGVVFAKSIYDPLTQAKAYADANPKFKQVQVKVGDNANNFTKPGDYYLWGANIAAADLLNWPLYIGGNAAPGVLVVRNPIDTATSASTQEFFSMYDEYSPFFRKRTQGGTWPTTWENYTLDSRKFNTIALTTGQDVLALGQGRYNIPSFTIGNSLLNMPSAPYKFGIIEVDVFAGYKVITVKPYGRDASFYSNASYEAGAWSGWQQYTPNTSGQLNALLKAITKTDYFGEKYTASELAGTAVYTSAYYAGFNANSGTDGVSFNTVNARIYNLQGGEIQYRVYAGGSVSSGSFGYSVSAANQANYLISGVCKKFPNSDTGSAQIIELDKVVSIPPNTPFVIVFRRTDLRTFGIGQHTAVSGNLENRGFNLIASAVDWGVANLANGSTPAFTQAGFQLLLNIETGSSPGPEPEVYTPELILPPKVYLLEGLQGHVYLEHLLVESYKQYEFDITCTKGAQRNRGFVWQPTSGDDAGDYPITIAVHDRQKGLQLNAISATLKLPSKSAKAGNVNVCFIADSLGVAGTITQRLLDISATDVTKVQLVGTRGTGLNKHEGRGGWTINDYTTAGRTYYQFTVSGVSETPAINATTYSYGGSVFMVQETFISSGSGSINCNLVSGSAPTTGSSGSLTKTNAAAGDASIAFSNVQPTAGNPFWDGSALNFANYLSINSLSTPDIVLIQLGINDTFGFTTDGAVDSFTATAFPKLDLLITSIKAANPSVKIGVCSPPSYADQDAFGTNYGCGQTSWRAKRNIVRFNKNLFAYFKDKEASSIFVVGSGLNVDTENNFPTGTGQINSHNTNTITTQINAVHPADSGYKQIGDAMFAFLKAV